MEHRVIHSLVPSTPWSAAMQDAYYTNSGACPNVGLSSCGNINVSSIQDTGRYLDLNETQWSDLYKNCSTKSKCTFNGGRKNESVAFTVVKYICIKDSKDFCNNHDDVSKNQVHDVSLLWEGKMKPDENNTCIFKFNTNHKKTSIYALEMRPERVCSNVVISENGEEALSPNCSDVSPYQQLVTTGPSANISISLNLRGLEKGDRFWIRLIDTVSFSSTTPDDVGPSSERQDSVDDTTDADEGKVAGGVAGGVVAAVVVIGAVVAFVFWFKYKRNKTPRVKTGKQDDNYSEVTAVSKNVYHKDVTGKPRSNYDYATVNNDLKTTGHLRIDNYDLTRTPVGNSKTQHGDPKVIEEDEYNHLDDQKQITTNGNKPTGYDTSASAAAAVRKLQNKSSSNREGDYDYNHLSNNSDVKVEVDYDTAESASRAVAQMVKDKDTTEDDYDHFHKIESKSSDSPYNTTEECVNETDYYLAQSVNTADPYDLAK